MSPCSSPTCRRKNNLVQDGSNTVAFLVLAGLAVSAGALFWPALLGAQARARRRLRRFPLVPISAITSGAVARARGRARVTRPLKAPLSGRACVYYQLSARRHGARLETILADEKSSAEFTVEDASGALRVAPVGAVVLADPPMPQIICRLEELPEPVRAAIARHVGRIEEWHRTIDVEVSELLLVADSTVEVCALMRSEPSSDPRAAGSYRETPQLPVARSRPMTPLILSLR